MKHPCLACGEALDGCQSTTCVPDPRPGVVWAFMHDRCYSKYGMPSVFDGPEFLERYPAHQRENR